jgi:hypothetical protein
MQCSISHLEIISVMKSGQSAQQSTARNYATACLFLKMPARCSSHRSCLSDFVDSNLTLCCELRSEIRLIATDDEMEHRRSFSTNLRQWFWYFEFQMLAHDQPHECPTSLESLGFSDSFSMSLMLISERAVSAGATGAESVARQPVLSARRIVVLFSLPSIVCPLKSVP